MVKVTFPDGISKEFYSGIRCKEIIKSISKNSLNRILAIKLNGKFRDLEYKVEEDCNFEIITPSHEEALGILRHFAKYLFANAIYRLYPNTSFGISTVTDSGFYYDIYNEEKQINTQDFYKIEKEMIKIMKEKTPFNWHIVSKNKALNLFSEDIHKRELISNFESEEFISICKRGQFIDLCIGPFLQSGFLTQYFSLLSISGAYWKGNSSNHMMQRIHGTAFFEKKDLNEYFEICKQSKERDHRTIGKKLNLFMLSPDVGSGLPFWLPNGATIRRLIERYIIDKEIQLGYRHVYTPIMANVEFYKVSGHWDHYYKDMFPPMNMGNGEMLVLRPMNCPHHMMVYKNNIHSYKDLPIKIAELGMMHRYEKSGGLSGLQRVREMTLNDGHIFVRPDQIKEEFKRTIDLIKNVYKDFDITDYYFRLSYRHPQNTDKYFNDEQMWKNAQKFLKEVMEELDLNYCEVEGEAAFYGPKLDVQVKSALGIENTLSTVQLDFLLPKKFDLSYVGKDGKNIYRPVVIHRGIISTMERFVSYLIEVYKGAFPTWLSPIQVKIIPISMNVHSQYAYSIDRYLKRNNIRSEVDDQNEKISYKIRNANIQKIPYQLVVGDKEIHSNTVSIRKFGSKKTITEKLSTFTNLILEDISNF